MRITFRNQLATLKKLLTCFDAASKAQKISCLKNFHGLPLVLNKDLIIYLDTLLFVIAYPDHPASYALAEKEIRRVSRFLQMTDLKKHPYLVNSGMPFTKTKTRFTHDAIRWLMTHPDCRVTLDSFKDASLLLNDVLKITLPTLERSETTAGSSNTELMDSLRVPQASRLRFLVDEFARLDHQPYTKDLLFERLSPVVCITPRNKIFSIAYNRLSTIQPYLHHDLLKKIEPDSILESPVPRHINLSNIEKLKTIMVIKNALALTARETDPCTYMDEDSLRVYTLERGISVAIFGMIPSRQLPLESYVGYTAFKNGLPVSYGGAWVFGKRANFGINIFKPYRNGESAYLMAQLLRVYRHVFNLSYFEVEPYQYGLDNPDGIASGAFWFYYRFGFRPLDEKLKTLARNEAEKIKTRKGYKSSVTVLTKFTWSNIALSLGQKIPPNLPDIIVKVTRMIEKTFKSNRLLAETQCRKLFLEKTKINVSVNHDEKQVLTEVALWAESMKIKSPAKLELMTKMINAKPKDVYAYHELVLKFYNE